jgi:hypothetical protein
MTACTRSAPSASTATHSVKAEDDTVEAVLVDVVARAHQQRLVNARGLGGNRRDLARRDLDAVGAALELDDVEPLAEGRRSESDLTLGVERDRAAVEHELVLTADHVQIDDRQACLGDALGEQRLALALLGDMIGRAVADEDDLGAGRAHRSAGLGLPNILTDRQAQLHTAELDDRRAAAGREIALLVEHGVVRQHDLAVPRDDLLVIEERGGIVDRRAVVLRKAHVGGDALDALSQALERGLDPQPHAAMEQQILGRIAAQGQLREDHEVAVELVARTCGSLEHSLGIGADRTDVGVDLS